MPVAAGELLLYADNRDGEMITEQRSEPKRIAIFLADSHAEVRSALRLLLEQEQGVRVVGEAEKADGLLPKLLAESPDLLLLDWELPDCECCCAPRGLGPSLISTLRSFLPSLRILVMSSRPEVRGACVAFGADAFISKGDPPERLLKTVRSVFAGGTNEQHLEPDPSRGTPPERPLP